MLLPYTILGWRADNSVGYPQELCQMLSLFRELGGGQLVAMAQVPRSGKARCDVTLLTHQKVVPDVFLIDQLVEKPEPRHPIYQSQDAYGIAGL